MLNLTELPYVLCVRENVRGKMRYKVVISHHPHFLIIIAAPFPIGKLTLPYINLCHLNIYLY